MGPWVLMPVTIRSSLHPELRRRAIAQAQELAKYSRWFANVQVVVEDRDFAPRPNENFFARLARMRQSVIDEWLTDHDHVLWIDSDIRYEPDTLERLWPLRDGIACALTFIEGSETNYDTAGLRESYEERSNAHAPWFAQPGPIVELQSGGACIMFPAEVHRRHRFEALPADDASWNTEYWLTCQYAINEMGLKVRCDTRINVHHANLPDYDEAWH